MAGSTIAQMIGKIEGGDGKSTPKSGDTLKGNSTGTTGKTKKSNPTAKQKESDFFVASVQSFEALTKTKALTLARELLEAKGSNDFRLGGVLSVIQANDYWSGTADKNGEKYDTFRRFMEEEFGLVYRKGMYLISTYNHLVDSGVPWATVENVGWTKLKEIAPIINLENVDEWVQRCADMTTNQLIEYIKSLKAAKKTTPKETSDITTMTFKLHSDQRETVTEALDKAKEFNGTDVNAVALEYICMQYLEGGAGKIKQKPMTPEQFMESLDSEDESMFEKLMNLIDAKYGADYNISIAPK
ncbi:MAG: hypothetical protein GWN00_01205 [Aliifodinibius sp.]|nr:hypothetical protein [Fodinibius sp.]NIV09949.1 hypothetical protein [Fodinibius sp.]NIY23479.1 hypothetical protein [Fodinibius sp.]